MRDMLAAPIDIAGHAGSRAWLAGLLLPLLLCAGCGFLGGQRNRQQIPSQYTGLKDKSLAIVVYAMPATIDEYAGAREEVSAFVVKQLRSHLPTARIVDPQEIINWQNNTMNWFGLSEHDIGKHFTAERVLFIEVLDYSTKRTVGYGDMQGHLRAQCKIIESDADNLAPVWTGTIDVSWPKDRPLDATQINEGAVRIQLLDVFAKSLVQSFYDHVQDYGNDESDR